MITYNNFFRRLRFTRKPEVEVKQVALLRQAALVRELEIKTSEERMRLYLMLVKVQAA